MLPLCSSLILFWGAAVSLGVFFGTFCSCLQLVEGWVVVSELLYGRERGMVPSRAQIISPSWAELHWGSSSFSPSTIKGIQTTRADLSIPADDTESWMDGTWPGIILSLSKPEGFFSSRSSLVFLFLLLQDRKDRKMVL